MRSVATAAMAGGIAHGAAVLCAVLGYSTFNESPWGPVPPIVPAALAAWLVALMCWANVANRRLEARGNPPVKWFLSCAIWTPAVLWVGWLAWHQYDLWAQRVAAGEPHIGGAFGAARSVAVFVAQSVPVAAVTVLVLLMGAALAYCCTVTVPLLRGNLSDALNRREAFGLRVAQILAVFIEGRFLSVGDIRRGELQEPKAAT